MSATTSSLLHNDSDWPLACNKPLPSHWLSQGLCSDTLMKLDPPGFATYCQEGTNCEAEVKTIDVQLRCAAAQAERGHSVMR